MPRPPDGPSRWLTSASRRRTPALCLLLLGGLLAAPAAPAAWAEQGAWTSHGPSSGGRVDTVAVDPTSPDIVYAGGELGLYKSIDGGRTWSPSSSGLPQYFSIAEIEIDPRTPSTLFTTVSGGSTTRGVYRSTDAGASWSLVPGLPTQTANAIAIHPLRPSLMFAAFTISGSMIYRSTDGGDTWATTVDGITSNSVVSLAVDPTDVDVAYAGARNGVFKTVDGGDTWTHMNAEFPEYGETLSILIDPTSTSHIYAGTQGYGLYESNDGGESWSDIDPHMHTYTYFNSLVMDPSDPRTIYAGTMLYVIKTTDGGLTWARVGSMPFAIVYDLAVPSTSPETVLAATGNQSGGVFRSDDRGETWTGSAEGFEANTWVADVLPDPNDPRAVLSASSGLFGVQRATNRGKTWRPTGKQWPGMLVRALAIAPSSPETMYAGGIAGVDGAVSRSTDGGKSWTVSTSGISAGNIVDVAVDAGSPSLVYAAATVLSMTTGDRMYRSTDGGSTWTTADLGLPVSVQVSAVVADRTTAGTAYAATEGAGIFKSTDGGQTWLPASAGLSMPLVSTLVSDPTDPATLYATGGGRIFKTNNRALTWGLVGTEALGTDIPALAVDPVRPGTLYAGSGQQVYRSTDGGATWQELGSALGWPVVSLGIDRAGETLHAGTATGAFSYTL